MITGKRSKLTVLRVSAVLLALYGINYLVTPDLVGKNDLEIFFRPVYQRAFESETWKRSSPESGVRYEMADSILTSRVIIGLDIVAVQNLLGKPDLRDNEQGEERCFYVLGGQRAYPSRSIWFPGLFPNQDHWFLEIRFREGKVQSATIFFT